jgi:AmmeMemoRadiSam system protein A
MTNDADRQLLLRLARDTIVAHVTGAQRPVPPPDDVLSRHAGVFVTIHRDGHLRGCIGHVEPDERLATIIPRCAVSACSQDPRFPPVSPGELPAIDLELSLLGPLERIAGPEDVETGRHGLVVEMDNHHGLLLPQVAIEWGWDPQTFLAQTCHKAGLPGDAWKQSANLWRFEAEVFGEAAVSERGNR